ncbi:MAG: endonuclease VIII, partial [Chloroflexi bacterium]|nr:endonuclease VIII [Chloroflexota bacterium]
MLELPEAVVMAEQITRTLQGKRIARAIANQSPHKFAWYTGDPAEYHARLAGKVVGSATASAGMVEIKVEDQTLLLSTSMRYYPAGAKLPPKHQLLLEFDDGSAFVASVQMWGCLFCIGAGEKAGFADYETGKGRPSPLTDAFDRAYFDSLFNENTDKLSAKAFLATE